MRWRERIAQGNHIEAVYEKAALAKIRFKEETIVKLKKLFSLQYFGWLEILAMTWVSHSSGGCYVQTRVVMLALMWAQCTNARWLTSQLPAYALSFTSWCLVPSHAPSICAAIPLTTSAPPPITMLFLLLTPRGFFLSSDWAHSVNYSTAFCQGRISGHLLLSYKLLSKLRCFDLLGTERSKLPGSRRSGHNKMVLPGASMPVVAVISRGIPPPCALSAWGDRVVCYARRICCTTSESTRWRCLRPASAVQAKAR